MTRQESFREFLSKFSTEEIPLFFDSDTVSYYSVKNKPLSEDSIRKFLFQNWDISAETEETEYIACCKFDLDKGICAVVYWRGSLDEYAFYIASFNKNGILIEREKFSWLTWSENKIEEAKAQIEDLLIIVSQKENHIDSNNITVIEVFSNGELFKQEGLENLPQNNIE